MPAISQRGLDRFEFLSDDLRAAIRRRIGELCGLSLLLVALLCTIALATWSVQDPSLSHATDAPVRNWLGRPGATFADLSIQLFGLASIMLVLPVAAWGWRLMTHRAPGRRWLRLAFWIAALVLASAFASCLPRTIGWPLPAGMGGVTGDAIVKLPLLLFGGSGTSRFVLASIIGIATIAATAIVLGFGFRKRGDLAGDIHREAEEFDEDEERGSVSLGWLVHLMLSAKARLSLFIRRRLSGDDEIAVRPARPGRGHAGSNRACGAPSLKWKAPTRKKNTSRRSRKKTRKSLLRRRKRSRVQPAPKATPFGQLRAAAADAAGAGQGQRQGNDEHRGHRGERRVARKRAGRFRRQGRDHQCTSRPGGDAVRTRAGTRYQVVARHRSGRRHRAFDECRVRTRRRRAGPQRHRHRIAERVSREGLFPRNAGGVGIHQHDRPSCRSVSARPSAASRWWSISRACRIC